jgi:hypothetical protein
VITGDMAHHPCQMAHPDWSLGDNHPKTAALTRPRLFAEWAEQTILVIGNHFAAPPPATSSATAQRSGLRSEGGEPHSRRSGRHSPWEPTEDAPGQHKRAFVAIRSIALHATHRSASIVRSYLQPRVHPPHHNLQ